MKRKSMVCLIVIVTIESIVAFSGCIEEEVPGSTTPEIPAETYPEVTRWRAHNYAAIRGAEARDRIFFD